MEMIRLAFCHALLLGLFAVAPASAAPPEKIRFNQHVRPILSGNCFYCHGPDPKHREADLRLDLREGATADLGGYAAIVPGKPDESTLIKRVTSTDPDEHMPPPASKKPHLTADEIAILRRWIEQGAEYEGHWAFLPLTNAPPPAVKDESWVANPIDRFILARLEQDGIAPSPPADPATLIRRLSLDLTGLLPSPEEVEAFNADSIRNPQSAIRNLTDRLLASPHYGERWGRHWLDQARYADSNGYSIDSERQMWPYRDWVIKALNDDMPFDRFTIEQLAGDLLPNATKSQRVATAFHRNTLINEEGGTDKEQFRHEAVVDRVNTTGAVWLGLTVGCCQCHTHKFDPIQHREYYELFAFFNNASDINNRGATLSVTRGEIFGRPVTPSKPPPPDSAELAKQQSAWEKTELARLTKLDQQQDAAEAAWLTARIADHSTASGAGFRLLDDQSLLSDGRGAANETYRVVARTDLKTIAAVRLRVLTHELLPSGGPGRAANGNFILTDFSIISAGQELPIKSAMADHEQPNFAVAGAIDDNPKTGWAINIGPGQTARLNDDHEAVFTLEKPLPIDALDSLEIKLAHASNENFLIGRFAIDFTDKAAGAPVAIDEKLLAALQSPAEKRSAEDNKIVADAFARSQTAATGRTRRVATSPDVGDLMVMQELEKPRDTYIYLRGDFLRPDKDIGPLTPDVLDAVPPKLPDILARSASEGSARTRLDLARWLVHPENPLTPRVTMNRMWMHYFGRGLVETEEDFGTQGTLPTHPELLDWLAAEFIKSGWSQKEMHRLIVTSNTYRQSSKFRPDLKDVDPRNLLLARQERMRFDAEIVRDAALSASGLLDRTVGGPSVKPPQPDGVYAFTQTVKRWTADTGPARNRRAMYTLFFRSAPHPLFTTFDAPDFQTVCTRRNRSNTPLQALTVANDEAFLEFSQALAARVLREVVGTLRVPSPPPESSDVDSQLRRAYLLALCRQPSSTELATLRGYYHRQLADLTDEPDRAKSLLSAELATTADVGRGSPDVGRGSPDPAHTAALILVCRAIFNTDSFITRE
jgi:hypothetical protein